MGMEVKTKEGVALEVEVMSGRRLYTIWRGGGRVIASLKDHINLRQPYKEEDT